MIIKEILAEVKKLSYVREARIEGPNIIIELTNSKIIKMNRYRHDQKALLKSLSKYAPQVKAIGRRNEVDLFTSL